MGDLSFGNHAIYIGEGLCGNFFLKSKKTLRQYNYMYLKAFVITLFSAKFEGLVGGGEAYLSKPSTTKPALTSTVYPKFDIDIQDIYSVNTHFRN